MREMKWWRARYVNKPMVFLKHSIIRYGRMWQRTSNLRNEKLLSTCRCMKNWMYFSFGKHRNCFLLFFDHKQEKRRTLLKGGINLQKWMLYSVRQDLSVYTRGNKTRKNLKYLRLVRSLFFIAHVSNFREISSGKH